MLHEFAALCLFATGDYSRAAAILNSLLAAAPGSEDALAKGVERGRIIGEAVNFARELSNEPSSALTPSELAERARETADRFGLDIDVLDEARMKELGMGALLGVARGSDEPAKMIVLRYTPDEAEPIASDAGVIAIVGKGITFDSGGISIKPAEGKPLILRRVAPSAIVETDNILPVL